MELRKITQDEFDKAYGLHQLFLENATTGKRLEFDKCDLSKIIFLAKSNLSNSSICLSDISRVELPGANFSNAELIGSNFSHSNLSSGNFTNTNMEGANLDGVRLDESILDRTNLMKSILFGASCRKSQLTKVNFQAASLRVTDLSYSILESCFFFTTDMVDTVFEGSEIINSHFHCSIFDQNNFDKAKLSNLDLKDSFVRNTSFRNAILNNVVFAEDEELKELRKEYQIKINELERNKLELLSKAEYKEQELRAIEQQLERIQGKFEEKQQNFLFKERIDKAFKAFNMAGEDLKKEVKRLYNLFWGYFSGAIVFFGLLVFVWVRFFNILDNSPKTGDGKLGLLDVWINISPSFLLVTFIILCIYQAHKCQRQLVSLRKLLYKPLQVKSIMETYITIGGDEDYMEAKTKLYKILDVFANHVIQSDVDTNKTENELLDIEKKESAANEKLLDLVNELIKKI